MWQGDDNVSLSIDVIAKRSSSASKIKNVSSTPHIKYASLQPQKKSGMWSCLKIVTSQHEHTIKTKKCSWVKKHNEFIKSNK